MKKLISLLLAAMLVLAGCGAQPQGNLMETVSPGKVEKLENLPEYSQQLAEFAVQLLQHCRKDEKNVLISPLSVLSALAMTANGADGETKAQMEQAFGVDLDTLNRWIYTFRDAREKDESLKSANGIWFRDTTELSVLPEFLQKNSDYYGAQAYKAAFDSSTVSEINAWVREHTDGMVEKILNELNPEDMLVLVNALAFEAQWQNTYTTDQICERQFRTEDNRGKRVEFMNGKEYTYLEDDQATGFLKYYKGNKYAFAAILPNEGISMEDYVKSLDGTALMNLLNSAQEQLVVASIPKFEVSYDKELKDTLIQMGMEQAFDENAANFTRMGTVQNGNLAIGRVIHSTKIRVDELGTKAGAATAVVMVGEGAPEELKTVKLDRPFVYLIVDCETNLPVFMGTMMDPNPQDPGEQLADHAHNPVTEAETVPGEPKGYCGNTETTVHLPDGDHSFEGTESVRLTALCESLNYDPDKACRCEAEFSIETEFGKLYEVNLTEAFIRCEEGQADLTQEQIDTVQGVLDWLTQ